MLRRFWERIWGTILAQLKQGLAPAPAALAVALGLYVSIFPALGTTTVLCAILGFCFRLNQPVLQAANLLAYPVQVALLFPFYEAGARIFGGPYLTLSPSEFAERATTAPLGLIHEFWWVGVHAWAVWAVLGLFVIPALWFSFRALFTRIVAKEAAA